MVLTTEVGQGLWRAAFSMAPRRAPGAHQLVTEYMFWTMSRLLQRGQGPGLVDRGVIPVVSASFGEWRWMGSPSRQLTFGTAPTNPEIVLTRTDLPAPLSPRRGRSPGRS